MLSLLGSAGSPAGRLANGERLKSSEKRNDERGEARGEVGEVEEALLSPPAASRALARLQKGERGKSRGEGGEAASGPAGITGARGDLSSGEVTPRSRSRLPPRPDSQRPESAPLWDSPRWWDSRWWELRWESRLIKLAAALAARLTSRSMSDEI